MGGGGSGEVGYPQYLERFHKILMGGTLANFDTPDTVYGASGGKLDFGTSMEAEIYSMVNAGNPYIGVKAYNPGTVLSTLDFARQEIEYNYKNIRPETDWVRYFSLAKRVLDDLNVFSTQDEIDEQVDNFTADSLKDLARSYNRVAGPMYEQGASLGTVMPQAFSMLEIERNKDIARFRTERIIAAQKDKAGMYLSASRDLLNLRELKNSAAQQAFAAAQQTVSTVVAAKSDQLEKDVELEVNEATWDLETLLHGSSVIGAIGNIPLAPKKPSSSSKAIAGVGMVAAGAAKGFATGGPAGAGAGAAAGLLGAFGQ